MRQPIRCHLLGVAVDRCTIAMLRHWLVQAVASRRVAVLANHNLHSVALMRRSAEMRAFYAQASLTVIDGMPLVWWGRVLGLPLRRHHRLSWLDHLDTLLRLACQHGWTVAHVGGEPGIGERAAAVLKHRHPGLRLAVHHGHFPLRGDADADVRQWLAQQAPAVVFVGMGMPRQEQWLHAHRSALPAAVYITSGATFDYVAGKIPTAPRWLGRIGLEWAFRLCSEPRRLARRYLIEPWSLMPWLLRDLRQRRFTADTNIHVSRRQVAARAASPSD